MLQYVNLHATYSIVQFNLHNWSLQYNWVTETSNKSTLWFLLQLLSGEQLNMGMFQENFMHYKT